MLLTAASRPDSPNSSYVGCFKAIILSYLWHARLLTLVLTLYSSFRSSWLLACSGPNALYRHRESPGFPVSPRRSIHDGSQYFKFRSLLYHRGMQFATAVLTYVHSVSYPRHFLGHFFRSREEWADLCSELASENDSAWKSL